MINKFFLMALLLCSNLSFAENLTYTSPSFFEDSSVCNTVEKTLQFDEIQSYYTYGMCHYESMKGREGLKKTIANLRKSAALGFDDAYISLGMIQAFSPQNYDRLEGAAILRMNTNKFPIKSNRYLGIYFLNERFFRNYSKPISWATKYLQEAYKNNDFAAAYVLAYSIKNGIIESPDSYQLWINKGKKLDKENIGYDRVISSLIENGYLIDKNLLDSEQ